MNVGGGAGRHDVTESLRTEPVKYTCVCVGVGGGVCVCVADLKGDKGTRRGEKKEKVSDGEEGV